MAAAAFAAAGLAAAVAAAPPEPLIRDYVSAVVGPPPASLGLDPFYGKHADALGSRRRLGKGPRRRAAGGPRHRDPMLARRPDVRGALVASHWRISVMAQAG